MMSVYSNSMVRICNAFGNYRGFLFPRICIQQSTAGAKQKTHLEKLGIAAPPKKPLTPFFRYLGLVRPSIKQKNPDAKVTDITKLAAEQWEKVDPALRQQLHGEYKEEMVRYMNERLKYEQSLTTEQKEELKQAKEDDLVTKERRTLKKKMKELGRPKKPPTGFLSYLIDQLNSRGDLSFREFQIKVSKEWENLPDDKKKKYLDSAKQALETFKRDLQLWEEKMVRLGHIDVVRNEALIEPKTHPFSRTPHAAKEIKCGLACPGPDGAKLFPDKDSLKSVVHNFMDRDTYSEVCPKPSLSDQVTTGDLKVPSSARVGKSARKYGNESAVQMSSCIELQDDKTSDKAGFLDSKKTSAKESKTFYFLADGIFIESWIALWEVIEEFFDLFNVDNH